MSWRTVVISDSAKLDYKMDHLVVRKSDAVTKIHLPEIYMLIIESTAVSVTSYLLCEMIKRKIKIIFCDEKRNPSSQLVSYYGSYDTSSKLRSQISWNDETKALVWTEIVAEKIRNQSRFLKALGKEEYTLLDKYIRELQFGDATNREGHAAKVYFNALFGKSFTRAMDIPINAALNYGYGILLSAFNRENVANGYITQVGIFHDNMSNFFNLGSDLIEPFRLLVDRTVYKMSPDRFQREEKLEIVRILNEEVIIDSRRNYVTNAIKIYCKSVFDALNENDISVIRFFRDEL